MLLTALAAAALIGAGPAGATEPLWQALRAGGHVVLIRHATTEPGTGDPSGFRLDDCATQRNLSQQGREEARRIGEVMRSREIPVGEVLSSQWCRCLETARLAFGRVESWPALNSNFNDATHPAAEKNREVRARLSERPRSGNLVLVTHNFNIRDLTGEIAAQGELVVVAPLGAGNFRVLGKLRPD
ncbi:MAG TPA: histidine phosphatase family protein [Burkholderiales bacterium]